MASAWRRSLRCAQRALGRSLDPHTAYGNGDLVGSLLGHEGSRTGRPTLKVDHGPGAGLMLRALEWLPIESQL
jgi:hypothetical protein